MGYDTVDAAIYEIVFKDRWQHCRPTIGFECFILVTTINYCMSCNSDKFEERELLTLSQKRQRIIFDMEEFHNTFCSTYIEIT